VETVDTVDKLAEIVWCDHLSVVIRPLVQSNVPHVYIKSKCYLAVEENKVKLVCSECWLLSVRSIPLPLN
jgi:hypothetical protein